MAGVKDACCQPFAEVGNAVGDPSVRQEVPVTRGPADDSVKPKGKCGIVVHSPVTRRKPVVERVNSELKLDPAAQRLGSFEQGAHHRQGGSAKDQPIGRARAWRSLCLIDDELQQGADQAFPTRLQAGVLIEDYELGFRVGIVQDEPQRLFPTAERDPRRVRDPGLPASRPSVGLFRLQRVGLREAEGFQDGVAGCRRRVHDRVNPPAHDGGVLAAVEALDRARLLIGTPIEAAVLGS